MRGFEGIDTIEARWEGTTSLEYVRGEGRSGASSVPAREVVYTGADCPPCEQAARDVAALLSTVRNLTSDLEREKKRGGAAKELLREAWFNGRDDDEIADLLAPFGWVWER